MCCTALILWLRASLTIIGFTPVFLAAFPYMVTVSGLELGCYGLDEIAILE